ncbi:hypothetical protein H7F51_01405 [Novosphingobium flavum]|uniref:Uncharacterized protein n=1 Tax=Novosphingobium flavum TaxID=1778672 RepID=A0A7X1KKD5_9SPHN|nr:hypothetical protein [Novosphingobium flavum]MBC2664168.1 hypothetical protein [Novosphingobium flavum]
MAAIGTPPACSGRDALPRSRSRIWPGIFVCPGPLCLALLQTAHRIVTGDQLFGRRIRLGNGLAESRQQFVRLTILAHRFSIAREKIEGAGKGDRESTIRPDAFSEQQGGPSGAIILLGVAAYFMGVVRAPLTADWVDSQICPAKLYHTLSQGFRTNTSPAAAT